MLADTIKAALVDTGTYTYSAAHDMYDDVSAGVVGTPVTLGTKTTTGGVFDAAGAWIITNLPKDANGYLLVETMNAQGVRTERQFTSAQTAGLRTLLDALVATID